MKSKSAFFGIGLSIFTLLLSLPAALAQTGSDYPSTRTRTQQRDTDDTRSQTKGVKLAAGTSIAVAPTSRSLYLDPQKEQTAAMEVTSAVSNEQGQIAIPEGSQIEGVFRPTEGGLQFTAKRLVVPDGIAYQIVASSSVLKSVDDPRSEQSEKSSTKSSDIPGAIGGVVGGQAGEAMKQATGGTTKQVVVVSRDQPVELELGKAFQIQASR
jgi:hypothetical protein